jgi:putative peptidoglycan lipid II flippase
MSDSVKSIHRSALKFFSGTMLSRITGMVRDMAMAFAFGTEALLSTFMIAFRFAHLARRLFGEGSLQNTFIPHFEALRLENPAKAYAFFRDFAATLALLLSLLIALSMGILIFFLDQSFLVKLTFYMLPSLLFICLYGLTAAFLECEKSYFIPSVAPVAFNGVWIASCLLLMSLPIEQAVIGLSMAVSFACFAQWAFTLPLAISFLKGSPLTFTPFSPNVRKALGPLFLANIGVGASQINNALDPLFALFANQEGPAYLWYSMRIQQLPIALFGIALSGALLPPLSRAIKGGNKDQFQLFFRKAKEKVALFTLPLTAGIIATAPACTNLLFGRGQFTLESVEGTARCLIAYGFGLFPMTFILIAAPSLYAFGDYKTPTRLAVIAMLINITLNALFVFLLGWEAASVALATSLAAFWNGHYLQKALEEKEILQKKRDFHLLKCIAIGLLGMGAVFLTDLALIGKISAAELFFDPPLALSQDFSDQLFLFSAEAAAFLIATLIGIVLSLKKEVYFES